MWRSAIMLWQVTFDGGTNIDGHIYWSIFLPMESNARDKTQRMKREKFETFMYKVNLK